MDHIANITIPRLDRERLTTASSAIAAAVLVYSVVRLMQKDKKPEGVREVPTPKSAYPYIGHLLSLGKLPGRQIAKWHEELNSPIIRIKMGVQNWAMISDPKLAHKIFVTNGVNTSARPFSTFQTHYYSYDGKGLAFGNGKDWKAARSAVLSVLAPKAVEQYMDVIEREANVLVDKLIETTEKEGSVYPVTLLELNSLNVICHVTVGKRFISIEDPEFKEVIHMVETGMTLAGADRDMPNFLPAFSIFDYLAGTQVEMRNFINNVRNPTLGKLIKEAEVNEGPNIFKTFNEEDFPLDEENKLIILNDIIAGGTDTGATTLSWNFAVLCHHPEVQAKIREEIDAFIKKQGRVPSFTDRDEIPYCNSVLKETMRLKPTTPFGVPHETTTDVIVDGYLIPAKTVLICSMEAMHLNEDVYPDAKKFIPERFLENKKSMFAAANGRLEERDHYNFGWGRRICPGIHLAEVETFNAFVRIFARCIIEPITDANGKPVYPNLDDAVDSGLTISPVPFKVKFTKRTDSLL